MLVAPSCEAGRDRLRRRSACWLLTLKPRQGREQACGQKHPEWVGHTDPCPCVQPYLIFTVWNDHSALQWLMSFRRTDCSLAVSTHSLLPSRMQGWSSPCQGWRHVPASLSSQLLVLWEEGGPRERGVHEDGGGPVCRDIQYRDSTTVWREQQEWDPDLQTMLQWVESG